jgi:hypothetical protein
MKYMVREFLFRKSDVDTVIIISNNNLFVPKYRNPYKKTWALRKIVRLIILFDLCETITNLPFIFIVFKVTFLYSNAN